MAFWYRWFGSWTSSDDNSVRRDIPPPPVVNPSTGLPMVGDGFGGVDVGGSPYGTDIHHHEPWSPPSSGGGFDNDWPR